jgi:hypothetical protein
MKGLALFGWVTLAVVGLLTFLFIVFFSIFVHSGTGNPLDPPDKVQALAALLALVFGSAAAVGGAIATIQVASLGLEISKRQELRDSTAFLDERASNSINLFSNLLVSVNEVFSSGVIVDLKIPHLESEGLIERFREQASNELKNEMIQLSEKLVNLVGAINNILRDDFANYCIQQKASIYQGKLQHISRKLVDLGLPDYEVSVPVQNLSDIAALIEVAGRRIDDGSLGDVIQARVFTNSSDIEIFNMKYNNRNVRSFIFLGNLIFTRSETDTPSRKMFIASYGAAILHDLVQLVPGGEFISKCLELRYPSINSQVKTHIIIFEPNNIASKNLLSAIEDVERIGDLYVLVGEVSTSEPSRKLKEDA